MRHTSAGIFGSRVFSEDPDWHGLEPVSPYFSYSSSTLLAYKTRDQCALYEGSKEQEALLQAVSPNWQKSHKDWFAQQATVQRSRKISVNCQGWQEFPSDLFWFDANGKKRGGSNLKGKMINLHERANVLAQLINTVRQEEGLCPLPITEELLRSSGRRTVEALLAEANPSGEDPGTRKNREQPVPDRLSGMTQWSGALAQPGDKLLDGTVVQVRTLTDPITNPNVTNTWESENTSLEARLATGAVGKEERLACIRCTNRRGRVQTVHVSQINTWFPMYFADHLDSDYAVVQEEIEGYNVKAAAIHVLAMRSYTLEKQKEVKSLMTEYHYYRPIIEKHNYQWQPDHTKILNEWRALPEARQEEIRGIKQKVRKIGKVMKSYSRAFSVLLGGQFTTQEKYNFLSHDIDLPFLLYGRPFIFPNTRLVRQAIRGEAQWAICLDCHWRPRFR